MVRRFQRCRWSATRTAIAALQPGEKVHLASAEVNNAKTSVQRLQDAYEGQRHFKASGTAEGITVTRDR